MKLIDNILYIEWSELIDVGVSKGTLDAAVNRKSNSWSFINDPADNRRVLVDYEKLGNSYKDKLKERFGNVYDFMAKQPIKNMVKWDSKAEAFFFGYKYDGNKSLTNEHVKKYTIAANWLNMLKEVTEDKKALKNLLKLSITDFYTHVMELFKIDEVDLPTSTRRLLAAKKLYEEKGYESLIDWRFGNKLAAKIKDELSESVLLEMIAHSNQFDDPFICQKYNTWAVENGYKVIDAQTVGFHRRKNDHLISLQRSGSTEINRKYIPQVKGRRPSFPLAFIESDDNHLDLLFLNPDATKGENKYYNRYKAIVVIDSYNDYVLGYAYSENDVTAELVRAAYVNAMYHIRSLTGSWHLPHQTTTDRFAVKELEPMYQAIGNYFKTPVGSKHRGYIEQFFGSPLWKNSMKAGANNYTGNNVTAVTTGVNREIVDSNKKERPLIGNEAFTQIENFFNRLRHTPDKTGVSKQQAWLEAFNNLDEKSKRPISDEQFLLKLGIEHNHLGQGLSITNRGVEPIFNNVKHSYDLAEYDATIIGKKVSLMYDPHDMSRVLVTDFDKIRVMAHTAQYHSRALADADVNSRTYLNAVFAEKSKITSSSVEASKNRQKVLKQHYIDAETVLQAGILVKEVKASADTLQLRNLLEGNNNNQSFDVFEQM